MNENYIVYYTIFIVTIRADMLNVEKHINYLSLLKFQHFVDINHLSIHEIIIFKKTALFLSTVGIDPTF